MGSSGGGGSSGAVTHSVYLESVHADWLNSTGTDTIETSITEVMDAALGSSPWSGLSAYDPAAPIAAYEAVLTAYKAILAGIVDTTNWAALFTQASASVGVFVPLAIADMAAIADVPDISNAEIVADVAAFGDDLDDEILIRDLPQFRRGMQDINAVVSAAFPIGEAVIHALKNKSIAKYDASLRVSAIMKNADLHVANQSTQLEVGTANLKKAMEVGKTNTLTATDYKRIYLDGANQILHLMLQRVSWEEGYAKMSVEANRIKIVAMKEQTDQNAVIDEADAKWDLDVFQSGANVMAASAGGTSTSGIKGVSKAQSAIGGAMMGGAAGYMVGAQIGSVGGPYGAAAGAVLGAAVSLLSS